VVQKPELKARAFETGIKLNLCESNTASLFSLYHEIGQMNKFMIPVDSESCRLFLDSIRPDYLLSPSLNSIRFSVHLLRFTRILRKIESVFKSESTQLFESVLIPPEIGRQKLKKFHLFCISLDWLRVEPWLRN